MQSECITRRVKSSRKKSLGVISRIRHVAGQFMANGFKATRLRVSKNVCRRVSLSIQNLRKLNGLLCFNFNSIGCSQSLALVGW